MSEQLFSAGRIGTLTVPNRIVMTAMGNALGATDGSVTDAAIAFYTERARGGVGLIITECIIIDWKNGRGNLHQVAVCDDDKIPGLTRLAESVHANGAKIAAQIYHPGRQGFTALNGVDSMPAPSALVDAMTQQAVHAMSKAEIAELIASFAAAAHRVKTAGFDAVELHAAHGYLLNSFLSPYSNARDDEYGGDTKGRARIVREIIDAVRAACGADFPILVRTSADEYLALAGKPEQGITLDEGIRIAQEIAAAGADALDISSGIYETMNAAWEPFPYDEGWKTHLAARVKEVVDVPVIGVAVYRNPAYVEQLLDEGKLDFVGSARAHFADPQWSAKASDRAGTGAASSIRRCISCLACMETLVAADLTNEPAACAINPRTGRELLALPRDGAGKTVVVIGAGPAGLEAAVTAAERGCSVILFEKASQIGGQLNYANKPPGKAKIDWVMEYYTDRIAAYGIDLWLNTTATVEQVAALGADAVIVASGSEPILPRAIPGLEQDNVHLPPAVLTGLVDLAGRKVAVVGSGMTGIETTELLAEAGCDLSLYEMVSEIGPGVYFQNMMDIMPKLGAHNVQFFPSHKLLGIEGSVATFEKDGGSAVSDAFDAFVISLGTRPDTTFVEGVKAQMPNAIAIGDANKPGRIMNATTDGYLAVRDLVF
ncbi:MAG: FAD-dependent oxidoreductase [Coriobacteriales bacterium]|jgi:2,4-dienoyl-CoA reductase-like NADH-dependent reductase (Old Yellow Enzyme family)/NADPH-dependent 2,4-dienoyl-CoA reductase/sulfur reductase-like enzyme|nr:FAD-dependent oxidoreductase [Coriobacteriales bacterium]